MAKGLKTYDSFITGHKQHSAYKLAKVSTHDVIITQIFELRTELPLQGG